MFSFYTGLVLIIGMSVTAISGTVFSVSLHANVKKGIDYSGKFVVVGFLITITGLYCLFVD